MFSSGRHSTEGGYDYLYPQRSDADQPGIRRRRRLHLVRHRLDLPGLPGGWSGTVHLHGPKRLPHVPLYSDNTITYPGWVATFDCVPYAAGPNNTDNNDCARSTGVCSNQNITDASTGPGLSSDITSGCIPTENYTNWYTIKIAAGGTLGFNLVPNSTADDYDFALFGPLNDCGGITAGPVRCSYGANTAAYPNTGMNSTTNTSTNTNVCGVNNSGADDTEDGCGNGWVNSLNVNTGETYMLLVSKWTQGGSGFNLA